jgi:hypothetical protein
MATNLDLISASLRLCKVLAETEVASAEQGVTALGVLNRMLEAWTENDIELGWYEQSDTAVDAPLPKWAEQGVISKLAQLLSGIYGDSMLAPWVWDNNLNGYGMLARKCMVEGMQPANNDHLPMGSGRRRGSILNG